MPRGYRCILVAFVGWLSLANAQSPRAETKQTEAQSNQSDTVTTVALPPIQTIEPVDASELNRPCDPPKDQRDSDLCAQWKAADAARDAADWTRWGVVLGVLGTLGLFWTLLYTRKAVLGGEASLEHARIVSRAQLRPWLIYESYWVGTFKDATIEGKKYEYGALLKLEMKNTGQTPAANALVWTDMKTGPADGDTPVFVPCDLTGEVGPIVGNGQSVWSAERYLGPLEYDDWKAGRTHCWFYMNATYGHPGDDSTKYNTQTVVCLRPDGEMIGPDGENTFRVSVRIEGEQNTIV